MRTGQEFIEVLRGLSTEQEYSQSGKYYNITDFTLNPAPVDVPGRAHPEIFFGGNSTAAQATAGRVADWYFSNGKDLEGFKENIAGVVAAAGETRRTSLQSRVSATPSRRPEPPPRTARACGPTPPSRTWSSKTTASRPS